MLNVAEGEPCTDGGWIKIGSYGSNAKHPRYNKMATGERPVGNNGHDGTIENNGTKDINAMKTNHCDCNGGAERGCMCQCKQRKGNQRLNWEIEHID